MRLALAAALIATSASANEPGNELLETPCLDLFRAVENWDDYGADLVLRGVEGVADRHYVAGMTFGIIIGFAEAHNLDVSDVRSLGFTVGQACGQEPELSFRESLRSLIN